MQDSSGHGDVLILTSHHSILDGWGERQLVQQLSSAYETCLASSPSNGSQSEQPSAALPHLPVQYTDFSHWQRQQMEDGAWQGHIDYWKDQLAGIPEALDLPSDQMRPDTPSGDGYQLHVHISPDVYRSIQQCAAQQQATVLMLLAAVFQVRTADLKANPWLCGHICTRLCTGCRLELCRPCRSDMQASWQRPLALLAMPAGYDLRISYAVRGWHVKKCRRCHLQEGLDHLGFLVAIPAIGSC